MMRPLTPTVASALHTLRTAVEHDGGTLDILGRSPSGDRVLTQICSDDLDDEATLCLIDALLLPHEGRLS